VAAAVPDGCSSASDGSIVLARVLKCTLTLQSEENTIRSYPKKKVN